MAQPPLGVPRSSGVALMSATRRSRFNCEENADTTNGSGGFMAIAQAVENYLRVQELPYDTIEHPKAVSSAHVAEAAHVPGDRVAKSVLLQDANGYIVAVLPSTRKLHLGKLRHQFDRMLGLAPEREVMKLFSDCDAGAIPAVGHAYDLTTVIDDSLLEQPEIYFEAGDHEALIHMNGRYFRALMADLPHGHFTYRS